MKTCWEDSNCYEMMLKGANGLLWGKLEESSHFKVLESLLNIVDKGSLLDVGCGAGTLSKTKIIQDFEYTGVDSNGIIEKLAKKFNPEANFIGLVIDENSDLLLVKKYDVVVMNAFLDVLTNPLNILKKILKNSKNWVIIHRQSVIQEPTFMTVHESYGGMAYQSWINSDDLIQTIEQNQFKIEKQMFSGLGSNTNFSFLLRRKLYD